MFSFSGNKAEKEIKACDVEGKSPAIEESSKAEGNLAMKENAWDPDSDGALRLGKVHSALGVGTVVNGKLKFDTPVRIDGKLSGELISTKPIIIGPEGEVNAKVEAPAIIVYGKLEGSIALTERLEVRAGGTVIGDFSTPRLIVDDGALVEGKCSMREQRKLIEDKRAAVEVQEEVSFSSEEELHAH